MNNLEALPGLITAAITTANAAGYASSKFVHNHYADEADLRAERDAAYAAADAASRAMWEAFYLSCAEPRHLAVTPEPKRCEEHARKGTGTGTCDTVLDAHGCPRARGHVA